MKVLYRDYKNKIEPVRMMDDYIIEYEKGAYDKSTKTIEIEFDSKYKDLFDYLTDEQILKICEIVTRKEGGNMKYWLLKDIEVFKSLNEDQKEKAIEIITNCTSNRGDDIIPSPTGLLKRLGYDNFVEKYHEIIKK